MRTTDCWRFFPFERQETWTAEKIRTVIEEYKADRRLSEEYAAAINVYKIRAFLQTPLAARMAKAARSNRLHREQPFVLGVDSGEIYPDTECRAQLLVQGIIDAYFIEDDEIVLVDYKTDKVSPGGEQDLIDLYHIQLEDYAAALERMLQKKVKETYIYSFTLRKMIPLS